MPGHVKKSTGPDPDPDPWLVVTPELKTKLKAKPYDAKKSCWVPDKASGGYFEGLIDSSEGEKVTVTILETKDVRKINTIGAEVNSFIIEKSLQERPSWTSQPSQV